MKKYLGIFSLLFLLAAVNYISAQEMPPDAAKAYNEGNKLMRAGDYDNAAKQYNEALKTAKDYRIYYQLGITLKKQGKLDEAVDAFKNAIQVNPNFDIAYNGLGGIYYQTGKYEDAVDAFRKFANMTKQSAQKARAKENLTHALVKLSEAVKKDGNHKRAIELLKEAIDNYPTDAAYVLLATAYYETGNYDLTLETADKALNLRNFRMKGAAYYYKGMALKQKQNMDKAKENFQLALKDPQYKRLADYELKLLK